MEIYNIERVFIAETALFKSRTIRTNQTKEQVDAHINSPQSDSDTATGIMAQAWSKFGRKNFDCGEWFDHAYRVG